METFVSVDDFTGTDHRRIEQAIAAITPAGGTIIFPKRTYTIDYLSNLNLHHNGLYNLLISPFTELGEILNTYGEVSNVASKDSVSAVGINIIGSRNISFHNIRDNKQTRFATPGGEGLELMNMEVKNSSFNVLELSSRSKA